MSATCLSRHSRAALALAAGLALWDQDALACEARIVAPSPLQIEYDAFALVNNQAVTTFDIENKADSACVLDLALVGADRLPVDMVQVAATDVRLRVTAEPGNNLASAGSGVWALRVAALAKTRVTLRFDVVAGGVVAAGVHADELMLELRLPGNATPASNGVPLPLKLTSLPRAQMNIAGSDSSFGSTGTVSAVSFGVLESGAVRRVFLQIRANTDAILSIDSQNLGRLSLVDGPAGLPGIDYSMLLNQEEVDLTRQWQRQIAPPRTLAGSSIPLDLKVETIGPQPAGSYADLLTIVLSAI